ncbi:DUF4133 domain-containing protein [Bacteroides acidifaciens]|uniref:DUF4133 domain-containing protein n=1 Tax=Bacteroides acidifaciens TaxID=85831 RepID=UPI002149E368|nr:DUF4133 domain-containing protein [Bacteroides acidifaciens]MCR2007778.1 DUF4133 domain-containing protein [Bacteroides acidifaciens]
MSTDSNSDSRYVEYPLFKGLQKPLEFMGVQGRYIYWAAGAIGGAIIGFIVAYCLIGFFAGLITLVLALGTGAALIFIKRRKGLHSKKSDKGVFIYAYSKRV